jgi:hypothetical protein
MSLVNSVSIVVIIAKIHRVQQFVQLLHYSQEMMESSTSMMIVVLDVNLACKPALTMPSISTLTKALLLNVIIVLIESNIHTSQHVSSSVRPKRLSLEISTMKILQSQDIVTTVRKPESGAIPNVFYVETSEEMLDPKATERSGEYLWTDQAAGVGHFAKYADQRLGAADTNSMIVQLALEKKARAAAGRDRAIIRDVMERLDEQAGKPKRSYDQPVKGILWDWDVAGYLVTKSTAAGLYILMMLAMITGEINFGNEILIALVASIGLLGLTGLLLINDLDKPMRFVYVLLRPNFDSWLVKGAYILGVFANIMVAHLGIFFLDLPEIWHMWLAILGIPLAWLTGNYTGWLFKQAKGREKWANRTNQDIIITGSIEMLVFGGAAALLLISSGYLQYAALAGAALVFTFGYKHILRDLRSAQMETLH